jgi:hypothetical protein
MGVGLMISPRSTVALAFVLSGCAAATTIAPPNLETGGAVFFAATLVNAVKPEYHPTELVLTLPPHPLPRPASFGEDVTAPFQHRLTPRRRDGHGSRFLVLVPVTPGAYQVSELRGSALKFPIVGAYNLPLTGTLRITAGQIVYLGHVMAVTRERRDGDSRAGPVLPLLDQAVSGFANSTWDIQVVDRQAEDLAALRALNPEFPAVSPVTSLLDVRH